MTYEELKVEADKLGYKLIKKQKTVKLLRCRCGSNRREEWVVVNSSTGKFQRQLICVKCGLSAPPGNTLKEAKENWNKMIEESIDVTTRLYK